MPQSTEAKPKRKLPTQRTLEELRKRGYRAAVTERWNPHARIRQDAFGFIDLVYLHPDGIVGVQCTSAGEVARRRTKITTDCAGAARDWLKSGGLIELWGWGRYVHKFKNGNKARRWRARIEQVCAWDLEEVAEP